MQVNHNNFLPQLPEAVIWDAINDLSISYLQFAHKSSLYARAYGMINDSQFGLRDEHGSDWRELVLNDCMRNALYDLLYSVQQLTEQRLGFNLTEQFHVEEIVWPRDAKLQLKWPGIEAAELEQNWYTISNYGPFDLEPYVIKIAPLVVDDDVNNTLRIAWVDSELVRNPDDVILRRADDDGALTLNKVHARYAKRVDKFWEIPIDDKIVSINDSDVSVQHRQFVILTVLAADVSALPAGGTVHPVYAGTNQIIPLAQPVKILDDGKLQYVFYAYTLIDPAFSLETVFWNRAEFYKLFEQIEFKYAVSEAAYVEFIWGEGDEETIYRFDPDLPATPVLPRLHLLIANQEKSILNLYINDQLFCTLDQAQSIWTTCVSDKRLKMPENLRLRVHYKTNPNLLNGRYKGQLADANRAILNRTAARLPLEECGCKMDIGFIAEQQKQYGTIIRNPITGIEISKVRFGQRHGEILYTDFLDNAIGYSRVIRGVGSVI